VKLSIIVPVYNVEPYIKACLESISNQKYSDFECIVVDDGSTDKSREIYEEYVHKDSRFHVMHQKNKGVNFARIAALQQAVGEYIGFVDADDYIDKNMFSILMDMALKNTADIVICGWRNIGKNHCKSSRHYTATGRLSKELAMEYLASDYMPSYLWNKIFKRHLLDNPQLLLTAKNMGDYSWMHYIFHKAVDFFYADENLYFYRYRTESIINNSDLSKIVQRYSIARGRREFYKQYYPQMLALANLGAFRHAWHLCKNNACPLAGTDREIYLDADSFIRTFASDYVAWKHVGKKERLSIWLYVHFTKGVRIWKTLKKG